MAAYAGANQKNHQIEIDAPALEEQRQRWWVYQANDLLHYSYETLLKYTLDTLEDYPTGIALNSLLAELVSALSEADHDWPPTGGIFSLLNSLRRMPTEIRRTPSAALLRLSRQPAD